MTSVQTYRRQGQYFRSKGASGIPAEGSYISEKFAYSSAIAGGTSDSVIVTAVTGKKIRVISYLLVGGNAGANSVQFKSKPAGASSAIYPSVTLQTNGVITETCEAGLFETSAGESLTITTGATTTTGVRVTYLEVDA